VSEQIRFDLIENMERFAWINLDLSDFEKERNHCLNKSVTNYLVTVSAGCFAVTVQARWLWGDISVF